MPRSHWQPTTPAFVSVLARRGDAGIVTAYRRYGYTMRKIAHHLGVHCATVSAMIDAPQPRPGCVHHSDHAST